MTRRLLILLIAAILCAPTPSARAAGEAGAEAADAEALWALLRRGGAIAMMRHALAPGTGDPPEFRLDDCATQRNLSEAGREQARAIGRAFRDRGVPVAGVLSSRWCRCLETGRLAFGTVTPFPPLDSFFQDRSTEPAQTAALRRHLKDWDGQGTLVLVTHQVNITALTGVFPQSGEMVVLTRDAAGGVRVAGRLVPG